MKFIFLLWVTERQCWFEKKYDLFFKKDFENLKYNILY